MKVNRVAHCKTAKSDKIYMVCIHDNGDRTCNVIGKWGRRGRMFAQQIKGKNLTSLRAENLAVDLFDKKISIRKGYEDIESLLYSGGLVISDVSEYLEGEVVATSESATPAKKTTVKKTTVKKTEAVSEKGEMVVVCKDNLGMEDFFDINVEYFAKHSKDAGYYDVEDRYGSARTCNKDRFVVPTTTIVSA